MVAKLGTGLSRNKVASCLGVATSTVVKTARRFMETGIDGLYDRRAFNGRAKVDERFVTHVSAVLCNVPLDFGWSRPTWTRELLCLELRKRGFPAVAVCTMGRVLAAIGARLGMPRPVVLCPWKRDRRRRRIAELRRLAKQASAREPVFYVDEVDIHLNPRIGRDWMLPGMQRRIVTPGKNEKRYLAGAFDARSRSLLWVEGEKKTSDLFCKLVWRLVSANRRARRIHIILDNYIIHSSRRTQMNLAQFGNRVVLHFLPPYCPDHNKIERVWQDLHANVTRNHRCRRMVDLMANVHAFLTVRNRRLTSNRHPVRAYRESGSAI
jgi:transposase